MTIKQLNKQNIMKTIYPDYRFKNVEVWRIYLRNELIRMKRNEEAKK